MIGKLLLRGMLTGLCAGLLTFGFAKIAGEPRVDQAISFEKQMDAAKGEAPEPELVSRSTQAGIGLFTGVLTYSSAMGGLFALVFAYAYGRAGSMSARALSAWLAAGGFIAVVLVPALKYPANPPSVGDPDTIGFRTGLFFLMLLISIAGLVASVRFRSRMLERLGAWNASLAAGVLSVVIVVVAMALLPAVDEVPRTFPASLLWSFRIAALGMQVILWTTVGAGFGSVVEAMQSRSSQRRWQTRGA